MTTTKSPDRNRPAMPNPRFHVESKMQGNRVVAWFEDIFYAYKFVEAVCTDRTNPDIEYNIVDTAVHI